MSGIDALSERDITLNRNAYQVTTASYGQNGWPKEHQLKNFNHLAFIETISGQPLRGSHCLDVGCGTGDMSAFLRKKGVAEYLGIDLLESSVAIARKRYPKERFTLGDFLATPIDETFDFAFMSGTLSVTMSSGNWRVAESLITKMLDLSRVGVAFNYISDQTPKVLQEMATEYFFYFTPRMTHMCQALSGGGTVISKDIPFIFKDPNHPGGVVPEIETHMIVVKPEFAPHIS